MKSRLIKNDEPIPAAAVAFVRDAAREIEVYLSRRPAHFRYYPGAFVFPGGRRDLEDTDLRATARREVKEEIGVDIDTSLLVPLRDIHTSPHAGPIYRMLTFAYPIDFEFVTTLNPEEVDEEVWVPAGVALERFDLPYQIRAAVFTISRFPRVAALIAALDSGSINEDYLF